MLRTILAALLLLLAGGAFAQDLLPGTVVPVMLSSTLKADKDSAGQKIEGRVMQDVPLGEGTRINRGSRVTGHLVSVTRQGPTGSSITLKFDSIEDRGNTIPLNVRLLALASMFSVSQAQSPSDANSLYVSQNQWVTQQVGGDVVNRGVGRVGSPEGSIVGTWLGGSEVSVTPTPNPQLGCPEGDGYDRKQAFWVFSSSACGTYGWSNLQVRDFGGGKSSGKIVLKSSRDLLIRGGSGWLLIANGS